MISTTALHLMASASGGFVIGAIAGRLRASFMLVFCAVCAWLSVLALLARAAA